MDSRKDTRKTFIRRDLLNSTPDDIDIIDTTPEDAGIEQLIKDIKSESICFNNEYFPINDVTATEEHIRQFLQDQEFDDESISLLFRYYSQIPYNAINIAEKLLTTHFNNSNVHVKKPKNVTVNIYKNNKGNLCYLTKASDYPIEKKVIIGPTMRDIIRDQFTVTSQLTSTGFKFIGYTTEGLFTELMDGYVDKQASRESFLAVYHLLSYIMTPDNIIKLNPDEYYTELDRLIDAADSFLSTYDSFLSTYDGIDDQAWLPENPTWNTALLLGRIKSICDMWAKVSEGIDYSFSTAGQPTRRTRLAAMTNLYNQAYNQYQHILDRDHVKEYKKLVGQTLANPLNNDADRAIFYHTLEKIFDLENYYTRTNSKPYNKPTLIHQVSEAIITFNEAQLETISNIINMDAAKTKEPRYVEIYQRFLINLVKEFIVKTITYDTDADTANSLSKFITALQTALHTSELDKQEINKTEANKIILIILYGVVYEDANVLDQVEIARLSNHSKDLISAWNDFKGKFHQSQLRDLIQDSDDEHIYTELVKVCQLNLDNDKKGAGVDVEKPRRIEDKQQKGKQAVQPAAVSERHNKIQGLLMDLQDARYDADLYAIFAKNFVKFKKTGDQNDPFIQQVDQLLSDNKSMYLQGIVNRLSSLDLTMLPSEENTIQVILKNIKEDKRLNITPEIFLNTIIQSEKNGRQVNLRRETIVNFVEFLKCKQQIENLSVLTQNIINEIGYENLTKGDIYIAICQGSMQTFAHMDTDKEKLKQLKEKLDSVFEWAENFFKEEFPELECFMGILQGISNVIYGDSGFDGTLEYTLKLPKILNPSLAIQNMPEPINSKFNDESTVKIYNRKSIEERLKDAMETIDDFDDSLSPRSYVVDDFVEGNGKRSELSFPEQVRRDNIKHVGYALAQKQYIPTNTDYPLLFQQRAVNRLKQACYGLKRQSLQAIKNCLPFPDYNYFNQLYLYTDDKIFLTILNDFTKDKDDKSRPKFPKETYFDDFLKNYADAHQLQLSLEQQPEPYAALYAFEEKFTLIRSDFKKRENTAITKFFINVTAAQNDDVVLQVAADQLQADLVKQIYTLMDKQEKEEKAGKKPLYHLYRKEDTPKNPEEVIIKIINDLKEAENNRKQHKKTGKNAQKREAVLAANVSDNPELKKVLGKYDALSDLKKTLNPSDPQSVSKFRAKFKQHEATFKEAEDAPTIKFLKIIATVLSLGLAYNTLWNTPSNHFYNKMNTFFTKKGNRDEELTRQQQAIREHNTRHNKSPRK